MNFKIGKLYTCDELIVKSNSILLKCIHFTCLQGYEDKVIFNISNEIIDSLSNDTIILKLKEWACRYDTHDFNNIMRKEILLFRGEFGHLNEYLGKYTICKIEDDEILFSRVNHCYGVRPKDYSSESNKTFGKFVIEDELTNSSVILSMFTEHTIQQEIGILRDIIDTNFDFPKDKYSSYHIYLFELILDENSIKKYLANTIDSELNGNTYYQIKFIDEESNQNQLDKTDILTGKLFVANSPFEISNKRVIVKKINHEPIHNMILEHDKLREKVYDKFSSSFGNKEVQNAIDKHIGTTSENIEIEHFYMGQANCSKIGYSEFNGYYDIGFSLFYDNKNNTQKKLVENNKIFFTHDEPSNFFILSHIHFDHVSGICNFTKEALCGNSPLWLIQNFLEFKNVAKYLDSIVIFLILNKVDLFLISYDDCVYTNSKLSIGRGQCGRGVNTNQTSILLGLKSPQKQFLFTGDCSYRYYNTKMYNQPYDYIQVCHHGTKLNNRDETSLNNLMHGDSEGICSVGINTYGHPNKDHLHYFNNIIDLRNLGGNSSYKQILS